MIAELTPDTASLLNQVRQWSINHGWTVEPINQQVNMQTSPETLDNHGIRVATPEGNIHLEPAGRRSDGTMVVDVYAWPTLVRTRLLNTPGSDRWIPVTDVGMELRYDWNEEDFVRLAHDMLAL